jgi:hypothetical protein
VTPVAVTVLVEIFTADGELAPGDSSFTLDLEPFGMTQVNDILKRLTAGSREGLIIRAGVTHDQRLLVPVGFSVRVLMSWCSRRPVDRGRAAAELPPLGLPHLVTC